MKKKILRAFFIVLFIILVIVSNIMRGNLSEKENSKTNEEILEEIEVLNTDEELKNITYNEKEEKGNNIIGSLYIEKIGLKANIQEGSSWKVLKENIGHIEGTSLFDGNVGLASHNRGEYASYFARINELEKGDKIIYSTDIGQKEYQVISKEVIDETDWSKLEKTKENKLTLITCVKDRKEKRLCVEAQEV